MGRASAIVVTLFIFFSANIYMGCFPAQAAPVPAQQEIKTADVNKDGAPDVTYYSEGKYVSRIEVDTNYDNNPDIVMHLEDGKFVSADADSDYDGAPDKEFSDVNDFNKWVDDERPEFKDKLNRPDWQFDLLEF